MRSRCLILPTSLIALLLACAAANGAPIKRGHYVGTTSDGKQVVINVSANGKRIDHGSYVEANFHCDGANDSTKTGLLGTTIKSDRIDVSTNSNSDVTGVIQIISRMEFHGQFDPSGKTLTGNFSRFSSVLNHTCDTGNVTYTATFVKKNKAKKKRRHKRRQ